MASKAIVFAGQGAQKVGMGKDFAEAYGVCRVLFDKADEVLGYPLSRICFDGPDEELTKSNNCQPGIFVTSVACYEALKARVPDLAFCATAGLSLGEWTALHVAGALSYEDTLRALEARGRFMQEACEASDGAMVSIMGLSVEQLDEIRQSAGVEVANLNSPGQTVLSGDRANVEKAEQLASEAGAKKTVILNVAGAFHSQLMRPAAERLADVLADIEFRAPEMPVVSNVTGAPHEGPDRIRQSLVSQVTSPVQWFKSIEWFAANGAAGYVECGPGRVLSSLIRRTHREGLTTNVQDAESLEKTVETLGSPEWEEAAWDVSKES